MAQWSEAAREESGRIFLALSRGEAGEVLGLSPDDETLASLGRALGEMYPGGPVLPGYYVRDEGKWYYLAGETQATQRERLRQYFLGDPGRSTRRAAAVSER